MPSKRDVLALLTRDELLAVVDRFGLAPPDRRAKDGLVDAIASSKKATLAGVLPDLSRGRLKDICHALGLDESGREKCVLVVRMGNTIFVEASREFRKGSAQNYLRDEGVKKIVATVHAFKDVPKYARVVGLDEIEKNDFNLNISRYVMFAPSCCRHPSERAADFEQGIHGN